MVILYTATLPNMLLSTKSFLVVSVGFTMYSIMSSANSDSFTSSFSIWIPFISFPCHIAVTRTSNAMWNKSGKSGHPFLVLILEEILSAFPYIEYTSSGLVIYGLYYVHISSLCAHFLENFLFLIINGC
uniref:Uncharacterized protein n=1 Tax=Sus scrofa TaxID=9823 RepID=A0A8D0UGC1_PIG